jgi:hypothetical protein
MPKGSWLYEKVNTSLKARSQARTLFSYFIFIRGLHGLRQYRTQRPKGEHVLHWDGSLKGLALPRVLAKMLSCKLLSTAAAYVLYISVMLIINAKNERSSSEAAFPLNCAQYRLVCKQVNLQM